MRKFTVCFATFVMFCASGCAENRNKESGQKEGLSSEGQFGLAQGTAADDTQASEEPIIEKGKPSPSPILGTPGDDTLTGTARDDTIIGLAGNDTIFAGDGNDVLIGTSPATAKSKGEVDQLFGGRGADIFVLSGSYVGDKGKDYAGINDFNLQEKDRVQLSKTVRYTYKTTATGTEIYAGSDLIARLTGVALGNGVIVAQPWVLLK